MLKRFALISSLLAVMFPPASLAQTHPFEALRGLERFDKSASLQISSSDINVTTPLSIRDIKIGDNVLQQAIKLEQKGGQLGRIRGGTRSDKIKFSFYQPYENTRLEQKLELYYDKYNGFIQQVTATYLLQDAYLSIAPLREQTLNAAVEKFGAPMTMQQAADLSGRGNKEIDLDNFIDGLKKQNSLHPLSLAYFRDRNISRSAKWVKGKNDYALLHSGFNRCYLWHTNTFNQILTFCFFDKSSANPNSRGIELDLHNFPVNQQIIELGNPHTKPELTF